MTQPDHPEVDALAGLWREGAADIEARLEVVWRRIERGVADPNTLYRLEEQVRRLESLGEVARAQVDDLAATTGRWVDGGGVARLYEAGAIISGFTEWTQPHRAAVDVLSRDLFDDVLAVTRYVDDQSKEFVRDVGRRLTGFKLTSGTPAQAQARRLVGELRPQFERRGMTGVRYADGSLHSFGEYTEMLLRTKTAMAYNQGTINQARLAGIKWMELLDGSLCGLTSHQDSQLANGLIVDIDTAAAYPIAHPNCRRSINPRPDLTSPEGAVSIQSEGSRRDQQAFEEALRAQSSRPRRMRRERRSRRDRGPEAARRRAEALNRRDADIGRAKALLEAEKKSARGSGKVDPAVLSKWNVTEEQYLNARAITKDIKRDVRAACLDEADDLGRWIADNDLGALQRPSRLVKRVDPNTGATRYVRTESGYDWMEQLADKELTKVRYRYDDSGLFTPDVVADQVRLKTGMNFKDDEAMEWLVERWLQEDALRSVASGRLPKVGNWDELLPAEWAEYGYDLEKLFANEVDAVGHVAQVQAEAAARYAARALPEPRLGPRAWEMELGDYVREFEALEEALANSVDTEWARARLRELAPADIDDGRMSPFEVYEQVRLTAQTAGRPVYGDILEEIS